MSQLVVVERVYPVDVEQVWRAITDAAALSEWMMSTDFVAEVGAWCTFRTRPGPGFDGLLHTEVLEVRRPTRLVYTWTSTVMRQPTTLTWTLEPVDGGTRLRLEHSGLEQSLAVRLVGIMLRLGWRRMFARTLPAFIGVPGSGKGAVRGR